MSLLIDILSFFSFRIFILSHIIDTNIMYILNVTYKSHGHVGPFLVAPEIKPLSWRYNTKTWLGVQGDRDTGLTVCGKNGRSGTILKQSDFI